MLDYAREWKKRREKKGGRGRAEKIFFFFQSREDGFVLFYDTWSQKGHSVSCMTILFQNLQITRSNIRTHIQWAVSLVIAYSPFSLPPGFVWACIWVNTLTFITPRGVRERKKRRIKNKEGRDEAEQKQEEATGRRVDTRSFIMYNSIKEIFVKNPCPSLSLTGVPYIWVHKILSLFTDFPLTWCTVSLTKRTVINIHAPTPLQKGSHTSGCTKFSLFSLTFPWSGVVFPWPKELLFCRCSL